MQGVAGALKSSTPFTCPSHRCIPSPLYPIPLLCYFVSVSVSVSFCFVVRGLDSLGAVAGGYLFCDSSRPAPASYGE